MAAAGCGGGGTDTADAGPDALDVPGDTGLDQGPGDAADTVDPDALPDAHDAGIDGLDDATTDVPPVSHAGVTATQAGSRVMVTNGRISLEYDLATGRFNLFDDPDPWVGHIAKVTLRNAESRALYKTGDQDHQVSTSNPGSRTWAAEPLADNLGEGLVVAFTTRIDDSDPTLVVRFEFRQGTTYLTSDMDLLWFSSAAADPRIRVYSLSPIVVDGESDGALFLGPDPATHNVLDNGYDLFFDFESRVRPVGSAMSIFFGAGLVSNWSMGISDTASNAALAAGFMTSRRGVGLVALDYNAGSAPTEDGRKGMDRFESLSRYLDGRAAMTPHDATGANYGLTSEIFYVDIAPATAQEGLEDFAKRHALRNGKRVWTDVPTGWNSWGGGSGSGGYGTNIDEALILKNLDHAEADFKAHGMKWFMLDDGWQVADGDWRTNPDRFPDHEVDGEMVEGMAWLAHEIRSRGMIPAIWISPFTVDKDSQLAIDHPDWFATTGGEIGALATGYVPANQHILDLSHPEVLEWLRDLFHKVTQVWGYKWIKMDFAYFALFNTDMYDPDLTPSEAYSNALAVIREAIGPDTFFLLVSTIGLGMEHADGDRITLDNEPWWGDPTGSEVQGFKPTVFTVAHRYWMSHGLWVNHPDLIFFRDDYGLTMNEARTFVSLVGLTGGIVKLGENYEDMHFNPDWREAVYRLLPVYPRTARPLDLFLREYPEIWSLPVQREDRTWHALGLFNWGKNRNIGGEWVPDLARPTPADEPDRTLTVNLGDLGMDPGARTLALDSWNGTWEWLEDGVVSRTLSPRTESVLILHPEPSHPAVAATSEHLLGGAVEVSDEAWIAAAGRLRFCVNTVPGRRTSVWVMDAGLVPGDVYAGDGVDVSMVADGGVLTLAFDAPGARTCLDLFFPDVLPADMPRCLEWSATAEPLWQKTAFLDDLVRDKHLADELLRTIRVDENGDVVGLYSAPSTGLWTAMYLASQSYRWAVTRDPDALVNARAAVAGLHHLTAVTGIPGLYGRAYQRAGATYVSDVSNSPHWVASTVPGYEGWYWNPDVSKDTMDGIMYGYATALELLDDSDILARVRADVLSFAKHLVDNKLHIIDYTGVVTEHGRLNYGVIDEFPGFNALLVLSWFRTAVQAWRQSPGWEGPDIEHFHDVCLLRLGDTSACPVLDELDMGSYLDVFEVMLNMYRTGCKTSYDNIDMVFQAIQPLMRRETRPELADRYMEVLNTQIWQPPNPAIAPAVSVSTHSLYIYMYGSLAMPPAADPVWARALEDAICTLYRLPRDRTDGTYEQSDVQEACINRMGRPNAAEVIPIEDRDYDNFLWRLDPYEITQARTGDPRMIHSPEDYLLAYWMGRYFGYVTADM
jgi:hypothetical protein